jgi:hypothetical protein
MSFERGEYMAHTRTPGCTDYSPDHDKKLKKLSKYAVQNAKRWKAGEAFNKPIPDNKVHSYGDNQSSRAFSKSNHGTIGKAKRFNGDRPLSSGASSGGRSSISPNRTFVSNTLRSTDHGGINGP